MAVSRLSSFLHRLRRTVLVQGTGGLSDGQLLEYFLASREEAAFEALVQRHGPMVLGVCQRVLPDVNDAEDAFQATFLVLLRKGASVVPRELVGNWLYGVAYRTALKAKTAAAKRRAKERQVRDMPRPAAAATDLWGELQPVLDRELNRLPDKYRMPVVLCDLQGKGRKEVARQLGWPEGTLSGRLARARALLARRLAPHAPALSAGALAALVTQHASAQVPPPLLANTLQVACLGAAATPAAAGGPSARVVSLADEVVKGLLLTRLKIALALVLALGLAGVAAGLLPQRPSTAGGKDTEPATNPQGIAKKKDKMLKPPPTADGKRDGTKSPDSQVFSARVVALSADGKRLTLELPRRRKGERAARIDVKLSGKTKALFFDVGRGEARPAKGYRAKVWLEKGSTNRAARVHFTGKQRFKKPADLSRPVSGVRADSKGVALELPRRSKKAPPGKLDIGFKDRTTLTFNNVAEGKARPTVGYHAHVWFEGGSREVAAAVTFSGRNERKQKGRAAGPPDIDGKVTALGRDGRRMTVAFYSPRDKRKKPRRLRKMEVKFGDQIAITYYGVRPGGARPTVGYRVQLWLRGGSRDSEGHVSRLRLIGPTPRTKIGGKFVGLSPDRKVLTVEVPSPKKGQPPQKVGFRMTELTRTLYRNVGPGEAQPTAGYRARVWLREGTTDTADVVILEKVPRK
jgi:RNA polymerase sigma factor (sigma-70 family)